LECLFGAISCYHSNLMRRTPAHKDFPFYQGYGFHKKDCFIESQNRHLNI
jgi:hypothetical protein